MKRLIVLAFLVFALPAHADVIGEARVIDGDTIEVQGQRIRLHGIDAPESRQLCFNEGDPWLCGTDATNALRNKINDRQVTCEELDRDRYERIIARCLVDGEDIGEWMVLRGWAKRYHYDCHDQLHTHLADFVSAYNFARRLRTLKGLTPYQYICKIWTTEPDRFRLDPIHQMPGLNTQARRRTAHAISVPGNGASILSPINPTARAAAASGRRHRRCRAPGRANCFERPPSVTNH